MMRASEILGKRVSDAALLTAQRAKIEALQTAARASGDTGLLNVTKAALHDGPETYDAIIHWADRRVTANDDGVTTSKLHVPKAKAYVLLHSDGSRRWKAGDVGVALPNTYPEKYDVLVDLGGRMEPLGGWGPGGPKPNDLFLNRVFYQHAEGVAPFTKAMLPADGEETAKYTFDVHREVSRSRRWSTWKRVGMVRAKTMKEAVAAAIPRWAGILRITDANVLPTYHPPRVKP